MSLLQWVACPLPVTCGGTHMGFLSQATPVSSLRVCPRGAMLARLEGAGDPGLTRRRCIGLSVTRGSQAAALLLLLSWAQGFEWQSEYLGHPWRLPQACCLHIPASRFPPGLTPHQGRAVAFASEAVARQPRPWVHRGRMAAPWSPGGRGPLANCPDTVRAMVFSFLVRHFQSAHPHF